LRAVAFSCVVWGLLVLVMPMPTMTAVHEEMHQGAGQEQQVGPSPCNVRTVLGQ